MGASCGPNADRSIARILPQIFAGRFSRFRPPGQLSQSQQAVGPAEGAFFLGMSDVERARDVPVVQVHGDVGLEFGVVAPVGPVDVDVQYASVARVVGAGGCGVVYY